MYGGERGNSMRLFLAINPGEGVQQIIKDINQENNAMGTVEVTSLDLMNSVLQNTGPQYSILAKVQLR